MAMTFDIPYEVENEVAGMPDLDARVALFLRHEASLEALRRSRFRPQSREIAARALKAAQAARGPGFDWDASFERFREQLQKIDANL